MSKTVLITGANGSLGSSIIDYFSEKNYQVIAVVRPGRSIATKENVTLLEAELAKDEDLEELFDQIETNNFSIDAGLLLAGGFDMKSLSATNREDLESMFEKNFYSAFFTAKYLLAHMQKHKVAGKIIFTGAKPALEKGGEATTAYTLSKTLLLKMVEIINQVAAKNGSQAAMVAPSIIDTEANRKAMPDADFSQWVTPEDIAQLMEQIINDPGVMRDIVVKAYKNS